MYLVEIRLGRKRKNNVIIDSEGAWKNCPNKVTRKIETGKLF